MNENNTQKSYLSFKLDKETFVSNVSKVLNILEVPQITEVPQTPDYMVGVMNLRGAVLPVIDMRIKFGMSATVISPKTCVLVVEITIDNKPVRIGALVDAVEEVLEIEEHTIKPSPTIGTTYNTEFIEGMVQYGESFLIVLNMDNVFAAHEIIALNNNLEVIEENIK
jgi:purine-binding chemotaxis protein CheW